MGLCIDKVSINGKVTVQLGVEQHKELPPYCVLMCLTLEGKLVMFHVARYDLSLLPSQLSHYSTFVMPYLFLLVSFFCHSCFKYLLLLCTVQWRINHHPIFLPILMEKKNFRQLSVKILEFFASKELLAQMSLQTLTIRKDPKTLFNQHHQILWRMVPIL